MQRNRKITITPLARAALVWISLAWIGLSSTLYASSLTSNPPDSLRTSPYPATTASQGAIIGTANPANSAARDTVPRKKPVKLLSSAGDTPLIMRHRQYLYLFSLIKAEANAPTTKLRRAEAEPEGESGRKLANPQLAKPLPNSSSQARQDSVIAQVELGDKQVSTSPLIMSIAKKEVGKDIYWLISFYAIWLLLKLSFPIYHRKLFQFTERAAFRLAIKSSSILSNLQAEHLFFRFFSLLVYTYLVIIYLQYYPSIAYFWHDDYWIFVKIFSLFACFFLLRFLLISFWNDKYLQRSQIILHSIYSTGFAGYFLVIATIFTFLNPKSAWYDWVHEGMFYLFLYFLFSKAILILREYLRNNHRVEFYLLCYLVLFEFSIPVGLLYLSLVV